jgi:class 3 adenylate cyclase
MALFGAPIAHEDHAQRACYAALHMRDELRRYADELRIARGLNFAVRMGLNSGEVVVGKIGDNLRMDYTAQGHTVGLAARMEDLAEPESALERAEHLVESIEGRALSPRILEMRGRLAAALGDAPASDRALRQALELYRATGATGHAERLVRGLGA